MPLNNNCTAMRLFIYVLNLLVFGFVVSCKNVRVAKFRITNLNPTLVDSLYFEPSNNSDRIFITLNPNDTKDYVLDMRAIHTDGAYGLLYKQNNEWKKRMFGYFANGFASEKITLVKILPDTVSIKQVY
jgi:hypothetical protein